jgi:hypothetical protein
VGSTSWRLWLVSEAAPGDGHGAKHVPCKWLRHLSGSCPATFTLLIVAFCPVQLMMWLTSRHQRIPDWAVTECRVLLHTKPLRSDSMAEYARHPMSSVLAVACMRWQQQPGEQQPAALCPGVQHCSTLIVSMITGSSTAGHLCLHGSLPATRHHPWCRAPPCEVLHHSSSFARTTSLTSSDTVLPVPSAAGTDSYGMVG